MDCAEDSLPIIGKLSEKDTDGPGSLTIKPWISVSKFYINVLMGFWEDDKGLDS